MNIYLEMIADDGDFIFMARNIDYIRFTDEKIFVLTKNSSHEFDRHTKNDDRLMTFLQGIV